MNKTTHGFGSWSGLKRKVMEAARSLQNIAKPPTTLQHAITTQNIHHHENLKSYKPIIFYQFLFNSIIIAILPNIIQKSFLHLHSTYLERLSEKVVNNVNIRCRSMASFMIATEKGLLVPTG